MPLATRGISQGTKSMLRRNPLKGKRRLKKTASPRPMLNCSAMEAVV